MMSRFCAYVEKMFSLGMLMAALRNARPRPMIPTQAAFASAFVMFATARGSLNGLEPDRRMPARFGGWSVRSCPVATPSAASMPAWTARDRGRFSAPSPVK